MRNASGHHRDEDRWPLAPLVAPRGVREFVWHAAALVALVTPLVTPLGWWASISVVGLTWLLGLSSRLLVRVGLAYVAMGVGVATVFATPAAFLRSTLHAFTGSRVATMGTLLNVTLVYLMELSVATLSVATLLAFDRRAVNRSTVDLRVWQRQQARRRQLLRRWHQLRVIDEVSQ
jgi:hypothetical protein